LFGRSKISTVEDFVNRHPKGFDMEVGERGDALSGGQRQAVAVARAFVKDTPIVILDEPTNSMDTSTEQKLIRNLKDTLDSQTAIIVTHKPSLLELVDRVIVMDNGKVVLDDKKDIVLKKLQKRD
jgi:ATP-binding cassette subfamily C protein LapB